MHIALVHPEIPWNTGNIARTCVATNTTLHLIQPLGFSLEDKQIRRSGLDYWKDLDLQVHESLSAFEKAMKGQPMVVFSRLARREYWKAKFSKDSILVFGSESAGLPKPFRRRHAMTTFRIPMPGPVRSLNVSTAAGIALFEAMRQITSR